jgi:UPF0755 protein
VAPVVVLLLLVGLVAGRAYEWVRWQIYAPMSSQSQPVLVTIHPAATADDVGKELQARGLIRDQRVFQNYLRYLRYHGTAPDFKAGQFELNRNMSLARIVDTLQSASASEITVRMPEGARLSVLAQQAQQQGVGTAAAYTASASDLNSWHYDFLQGRPQNAPQNLEGFLFPDTYQILRGAGVNDLIKRQLDRFGQVVSPDLRQAISRPAEGRPAETLYNVLILASIAEKEVNTEADRPIVCDVFYNRLKQNMPLGSDATVLYAVGKQGGVPTQQELAVNSPYNTRLHGGLPPGPIDNPSMSAIKACISPAKTSYLYFFTDPKGVAHYAVTYQEFLQQQRQYGLASQ